MHRLLICAALTGACLSAQSTNVVFPTSQAMFEGNSNNIFPLGRNSMRYQQLEIQAKSKAFVLRGMEFRRDGETSTTINARTLTATILVGNGNNATFTTDYSSNWVGTPTTVVNNQTFNLPALPKPTTPPAPFAVKFPFSNVTAHSGQNELLWEMAVTSNATELYICDAHTNSAVRGQFRFLGPGCQAFGLSLAFRTTTALTELLYSARGAPANTPVVVLLGAVNPDLQLPGVCAKLYSLTLTTIPLGTSNASGSVPSQWFGMGPWNPAWGGGKLYSQAFAPDPTSPTGFVLSNGMELTLPATGPQPEAQRRLVATSATATTGSIGVNYGLVVRFP